MKVMTIALINFYQVFLSFDKGILRMFAPGGACKYEVRCSEYMKESILAYGILKGTRMGLNRILSCW